MRITYKDINDIEYLEGYIIDNTLNTVTLRLDHPVTVPPTTFPTPVNRGTLEYTIPRAKQGLRTLYEEWQAQENGYRNYRYLLMSPIIDDCDVDSHLDQAHELSRTLTIKYLSKCGQSPLLQHIIETFRTLPDIRLTLDYTLEPDSRLVRTIGFRIVENDTVREYLQGNTTEQYDFTPILEDYFVRQLGYPAVFTRNLEETRQFIAKLFDAVPLSRDYLRIVYVPTSNFDARWYDALDTPSALSPWYIEKQYDSLILRARVLRHTRHELHAVVEDHCVRLESHIYDPDHTWGIYGQKDADLLLDRFHQILECLHTKGSQILQAYARSRHELEALQAEKTTLPAYDEEEYDQRCVQGKIDNWYNNLLRPFIFYPVHNGEEIIRYLQSQQQRNE